MMVHELNQRLGNMFHGPFGRGQSIVFGFFAGKVQGLALCFQKDFVVRSRIVIDRIFAMEKNNKGSSLPDKIQDNLPEPLKRKILLMRPQFITLIAFLAAGAAQADVVIQNVNASVGSGESTAGGFTISFTNSGTSATLSSIQFFNSGGLNPGGDTATFALSNGSTIWTDVNLVSSSSYLFTFNNIAGVNLASGNYTLAITNLAAGYDFSSSTGTTLGAAGTAYGFSSPTATSVATNQFLNYQLSAVPEPGTMLLGGIAAACGVAGVWWKQRRAAAEAAATSA